jgi:hypothetical protein
MHQYDLPGLEPGAADEGHMRRVIADGEGGGLGVAHAGGDGIGGALRRPALVGEGALPRLYQGGDAHDLGPDRRGHIRARRDNLADEFKTWRERHGRLQGIGPAALQHVRQGEAAGDDPDIEIARPERRKSALAELEGDVGFAIPYDLPSPHVDPPHIPPLGLRLGSYAPLVSPAHSWAGASR